MGRILMSGIRSIRDIILVKLARLVSYIREANRDDNRAV
jgi:hypothetical protein